MAETLLRTEVRVERSERGFSTRSGLCRQRGWKRRTRVADFTRCGLQVRAPAKHVRTEQGFGTPGDERSGEQEQERLIVGSSHRISPISRHAIPAQ